MGIDPSIPTDDLGSFAAGQAYRQRASDIRESRQQGKRHTGYVKVLDAKASKRSETSQRVTACIDMSGLTVTDKNGTKVDPPRDREGRIYRVERGDGTGVAGRWRVTATKVQKTC